MSLTRRRLFQLTAASAVALSAPAFAAADLPIIYGNGVDYDTLGWCALLRGDPVDIRHQGIAIEGRNLVVRGAHILLDAAQFDEQEPAYEHLAIIDCKITTIVALPYEPVQRCHAKGHDGSRVISSFERCYFDVQYAPGDVVRGNVVREHIAVIN